MAEQCEGCDEKYPASDIVTCSECEQRFCADCIIECACGSQFCHHCAPCQTCGEDVD